VVVEIQLFSNLRDHRPGHDPRRPEPVDLSEGATVHDLLATLGLDNRPLLVFVGRTKVPPERTLADGDRVGLFPPMIGG